uniref:Protein phosphatase 1 regulatory subunit 19 n=1 Tax=Stegastes partitus TaxID=144197 RepID=A0A3B4Z5K8_9TELE
LCSWRGRMADKGKADVERVVVGCVCRKKVSGDYEALSDRLQTLPDQLSYDIMVPFGPLAFMPGKLVHTNEVTVLLGDNWFAKCSAKQAQKIVDHRMKYVKNELDDLSKTMKNFETRVGFAKDLETISAVCCITSQEMLCNAERGQMISVLTGKQRIAHKPNSKPKLDVVWDLKEEDEENEEEGQSRKDVMTEEELWARLDELEKYMDRPASLQSDILSDNADMNGEDTSSSSSEEEKEAEAAPPVNGLSLKPGWSSVPHCKAPLSMDGKKEQDDEEEEDNCLPTIFFSHTVELKKVRINTGKNTMLKFSERKEQKEHSKRKKKNGHNNGHSHHELHKITTPADIYRLFVDVKNGEPIPRKSILKSRSRENSVCSDTSESSAADFDERRMVCRSFSHDEATHSDTSDGITEEDSPTAVPLQLPSRFEAFSGTVVEKDPMPTAVPHLTIAPPALPTILERKQEEVAPDVSPPQQAPKRVSKFKAARLQQK